MLDIRDGPHWTQKISNPFSSKPESLILLMLLGVLGIVQNHFQYSSPHRCQGHGHTSHCCLPSITHCFLVVCWQAEEDRDSLWRFRAPWTTSPSAESLMLVSWGFFKDIFLTHEHKFSLKKLLCFLFVDVSYSWNEIRRDYTGPATALTLFTYFHTTPFMDNTILGGWFIRCDDIEPQKFHHSTFHNLVRAAPIFHSQFHICLIFFIIYFFWQDCR